MKHRSALVSIGVGAALWGIIGVFVTYLYDLGFSPVQVVALRVFMATVFMSVYVAWKDRRLFRIKPSDSRYFVGTGIISIVFFNWCLFSAMEETSISIAFVLLYTAPAFVTILSKFLFQEPLTTRKISALFTTLIGCTLVIGLLPNMSGTISLYGLLLGLGSGLFYALYSIFGKYALQKHNSLTVTVYTFLFAALAVVPFSGLVEMLPVLLDWKVWGFIAGLGFLCTMLPFILYTKGLERVESSRASIIATIEPVVASLTGFLLFNETLTLWQYIGIAFVIGSVIMVQETRKETSVQGLEEAKV
ncbi:transporter [Pontibacillus chungwhensis BH030062]|uniref:Transporter n=1 Tax=Pontibacillus chungwhensis BH030062 TaxID=1385513 RepID=A0A0A2UX10_9BACI|nr:EamA family transporter [Pontibacillus chungwhensis]KGP91278.1 transporter [Pontibacillus chungwhensis BH030062]